MNSTSCGPSTSMSVVRGEMVAHQLVLGVGKRGQYGIHGVKAVGRGKDLHVELSDSPIEQTEHGPENADVQRCLQLINQENTAAHSGDCDRNQQGAPKTI